MPVPPSSASKVQVWVVRGKKRCLSGPATLSDGLVLSIVVATVATAVWPSASNAVALNSAGPSAAGPLANVKPYGATVSV